MLRSVAIAILVTGCAVASDATFDAAIDADLVDTPDGCVATQELCNAADEDCDGKIDESFTMKGMPCSAGVGACAATGHFVCDATGAMTVCDATPGVASMELCDGIDNDCDGSADEDFHVGMPCDGGDADFCAEGTIACVSMTLAACTDNTGNAVELCNAMDDDCDGSTDEGYVLGTMCDGADADACAEGITVCNSMGGVSCNDASGDSIEKCNGIDDDCRNGVDDPWPTLGQPCSVGLGACARSGSIICNGGQTSVQCSVAPGAPTPETCGNATDEDCNGADAICPSNDLASGAIDISNGGTFSVDLAAAHDDNWAPSPMGLDCGMQGGRDVFYQFTLPAAEVVYFDSFGSSYDSVIRVFAGACTAIGATQTCADDACGGQRSQGALQLAAGTYCLVVDQYSNTATTGATTLTFRRGGRTGTAITNASGSVSGTTTGKTNLSTASCEANSNQPDVGYFFLTCPGNTSVAASTCTGTAFDSILYLRAGSATTGDVACSDDVTGCGNGLQAYFTGVTVSGPNLMWLIVDGFGQTGNGNYTLTYSMQ